mgnify:CR=1 FL=1
MHKPWAWNHGFVHTVFYGCFHYNLNIKGIIYIFKSKKENSRLNHIGVNKVCKGQKAWRSPTRHCKTSLLIDILHVFYHTNLLLCKPMCKVLSLPIKLCPPNKRRPHACPCIWHDSLHCNILGSKEFTLSHKSTCMSYSRGTAKVLD